jgi:hypothetical protein
MEFLKPDEETTKTLVKKFLEVLDEVLGKPSTERLKASKDAMTCMEALTRTQKIVLDILNKNHGLQIKFITEAEAKRIGKLS